MKRNYSTLLLILTSLILSSCSAVKTVPEGDYLYLGGRVNIEDTNNSRRRETKALTEELEGILRPKPNSRFLGIPFKLWIYNFWGNPKKEGGLMNKIRDRFGEPPVLFSQVKVDYNQTLVQNRLENRGYFRSSVSSDTTLRRKRARLTFNATTGPQYMINTVTFTTDSSDLGKAVNATSPRSFLKVGEAYDLDVIRRERERIDTRLKENGFYYFSPDYLIVQVDSTNNQHKVDLIVNVKRETPYKAQQIYNIDNIYIYSNYDVAEDSTSIEEGDKHRDFYVIDSADTFNPRVFERTMFFQQGDVYNRTDHNMSLNRLMSLGTFKFVKNQFVETPAGGDNKLDTYYYLTPYTKKSLRAEFTGRTTSANFSGTEVTLSWRNRNAFRGAELLTLSAYGGTDVQVSGINKGNNLYRLGAEANLNIPRFISPIKLKSNSAFIPRTRILLGADLLNRFENYSIASFRTSFGYIWKEDVKREHQLNLLSVNYVRQLSVTAAYDSAMRDNPNLRKAIEEQFIVGPNYNFLYTNTTETRKTNTFYYNGNIDLSGTLLGLVGGGKAKEGNYKEIFGTRFSQYIRLENDFRHYYNLGFGSQIASRLILGLGLPYGNSASLPFIKQFFIGGTNSLRGFRARSIGPGSYDPDEEVGTTAIAADRTGDLKLEINTEYRPKINQMLRGAFFVDAGNIWLVNDDPEYSRPGAKFSKDFLKELAVDAGIGLRFDLNFFVLRTDLAMPLRKPWLPEGERWVMKDIKFTDPEWRRENLVFNLAIGYPF
ncbi:BamA/TamA family outer membrane protein [Paradesertivirga mongoliensis]|uniref:BamA/TamA family outer membrane protein n=1 Tax=Paradesertivirga mongoliensis TaxID=2100740 RepID=A0ABW4ZKI6_9SPHI|nr:BamA/TamA family outer membrane protein [Pedobacter mongoliensis]